MQQKKFLITVDTEGDDLWHWKTGKTIATENTLFIPRFQELCEKYGFQPVYLTNYEMAEDDRWVKFAGKAAQEGKCEIGMHLHAWNTPPIYPLQDRFGGNPYITEYPDAVIEEKVSVLASFLRERFQVPVVTHRSGRWATNESYFAALVKHGIRVDCSVTPGVNMSGVKGCSVTGGNDYTKAPKDIYEIYPGLVEVPMTTRKLRHACYGSVRHRIKSLLLGEELWLRPIRGSIKPMLHLSQKAAKEQDYLQFMVHSSELMPGGSVYFKDAQAIERLYGILEQYFRWVSQMGYTGATLAEYAGLQEEL